MNLTASWRFLNILFLLLPASHAMRDTVGRNKLIGKECKALAQSKA